MPQTLQSSWKRCASCALWSGPRKPGVTRDRVEFENVNVKGECVGGQWDKRQISAMQACNRWTKWQLLK